MESSNPDVRSGAAGSGISAVRRNSGRPTSASTNNRDVSESPAWPSSGDKQWPLNESRAMSRVWSVIGSIQSDIHSLLKTFSEHNLLLLENEGEADVIRSTFECVVEDVGKTIESNRDSILEEVFGLVQMVGNTQSAMKNVTATEAETTVKFNELRKEFKAFKVKHEKLEEQIQNTTRQLERRISMSDELRSNFLKAQLMIDSDKKIVESAKQLQIDNDKNSKDMSKLRENLANAKAEIEIKADEIKTKTVVTKQISQTISAFSGASLGAFLMWLKTAVDAAKLEEWMKSNKSVGQVLEFLARSRGLSDAVRWLQQIEPQDFAEAVLNNSQAESQDGDKKSKAVALHSNFKGLFGQAKDAGMDVPEVLRTFLGKKQALPRPSPWPVRTLKTFLMSVYKDKYLADVSDGHRHRKSLPDYLVDFLLARYGTRSAAQQMLLEMFSSIDLSLEEDAEDLRVQLFLRFAGMQIPSLPTEALDYCIATIIQVYSGNDSNGSDAIRTVEGRTMVPLRRIRHRLPAANMYTRKLLTLWPPPKAKAPKKSKKSKSKAAAQPEEPREVELDKVIHVIMEEWLDADNHNQQQYKNIFEKNDVGGEGVLTFLQFEALMRHMHPTIDPREAALMFREALSTPFTEDGFGVDSINVDVFSNICRAHGIGRPPPFGAVAPPPVANCTPFPVGSRVQTSHFDSGM